MSNSSMPPNVGSSGTANTFESLQVNTKVQYPSPSNRRKRFAKIRKMIKGQE